MFLSSIAFAKQVILSVLEFAPPFCKNAGLLRFWRVRGKPVSSTLNGIEENRRISVKN